MNHIQPNTTAHNSAHDCNSKPAFLSWADLLAQEKKQEYFKEVMSFVEQERKRGKIIYPKNSEIFNALAMTPFHEVKVVILGQDPYHGPNQAHGLCFSVKHGVATPPSLQNIYKELQNDLGIAPAKHGLLESWARQGVLLLNAVLSVEAGKAGSHAGKGWEQFTDRIISLLNEYQKGLVFLLWGSYAQKKGQFIDRNRHSVLSAPHPSPLSAHRGFFGCKHFSKTNDLLEKQGKPGIDWALPAF